MNDSSKRSTRAARPAVWTELLAALAGALLWACAGGGSAPPPRSAPPEPVLPEPSAPAPKASPEVLEAERLLAQGDFEGARAGFETALVQDSRDVRALLGLGLSLEGQGDPDGAEEVYREALNIDPTFAEAWNNLALVLRDAGEDAEALEALERAVEADPELASAHANLAMALEDLGEVDAAVDAYERSLALDGAQTMVRVNYGLLLLAMGDQEAASRELTAAWKTAEGNRAALLAIGNGLRRCGQPAQAAQAVQQAIEAGTSATPALLAELALAQHAAGDSEAAQASLEQAIAIDSSYATAHYLLGGIAAARGQFAVAEKAYQSYLRLSPTGPMADKAKKRLKAVRAAKKK